MSNANPFKPVLFVTRLSGVKAIASIPVAILLLHGCATVSSPAPTVKDDGIQVHEQGVEIDPFYKIPDADSGDNPPDFIRQAPQISTKPTSGTVLALLSQAKEQEKAGNPEKAAAVVERALRIEPKNAQLWYRLALLRLQQGQLDLAKSLAAKSSALAQGDEDLQVKNRTIMEQVDLLQGR